MKNWKNFYKKDLTDKEKGKNGLRQKVLDRVFGGEVFSEKGVSELQKYIG